MALVVVIASVLLVTVGGLTGSGGNDGGSYPVERPDVGYDGGSYPVERPDVGPGEEAIGEFTAETGIDVYGP